MGQARTGRWEGSERRGSGTGWRNILPAAAAVLVIVAAGARAQQNLGELVKEYGFDWMSGRWAGETDEGHKFQLVYRWELNRHMISVHLKGDEYEYRGMIFYAPGMEQVVQVGADNKGGSGKGFWEVDGDRSIVRIEHTGADGETGRMAIAHSKVDAKTMKAEVYGIEDTGELSDEPRATMEYKRQKRQPLKKAVEKAGEVSKARRRKKAESDTVQ